MGNAAREKERGLETVARGNASHRKERQAMLTANVDTAMRVGMHAHQTRDMSAHAQPRNASGKNRDGRKSQAELARAQRRSEEAAVEIQVEIIPGWVEAVFTVSVIMSTALIPFVLALIVGPMISQEIMASLITPPWVYLTLPYIIVMSLIGAKIASLFGCGLWDRLISDPADRKSKKAKARQ